MYDYLNVLYSVLTMAENNNVQVIIDVLNQGELVVMHTDTVYGVLAVASMPLAMDKLYSLKHRDSRKSSILLVAKVSDIPNLNGKHLDVYLDLCKKRPTTVVVPVPDTYMPHLVRQTNTLAFRLIKKPELVEIIKSTGPLAAPSANPQGAEPANSINQAKGYFDEKVALYIDAGVVEAGLPSKIITINDDDEIEIIRD